MGTLGCIHDMMRRDKENRELRQASSYSFRGKAGGDKETDTRERTSGSKPSL